MNILSLRPRETNAAPSNLAGLDAVRGCAALGVVLFHSCIAYLRHPMPGLVWPVRDESSFVTDTLYWWIELFIMPLFLVMSGFLAWKTLERRGEHALLNGRARRLLIPLLFGAIVILPLDLYCWLIGWAGEAIIPLSKLRSLKFEGGIDRDLWGLSHLWYLQYLFLYVVVLSAVSILLKRVKTGWRPKIGPRLKVAIVLLLGTLVLYLRPEVVWGFQHAFEPVPSKWAYSGLFFALGAILAMHDQDMKWLKNNAFRLVGPAAVVSGAAVVLGDWHLSGGENETAQVTLAALSCGSAALLTMTILGFATSRIKRTTSIMGYLSASSFWIYIVHHPILGLVHIDLKLLMPGVSPVIKMLTAFTITAALCLITYEVLVRRTRLGRWLGFAWEFPVRTEPAVTTSIKFPGRRSSPPAPARRAA